MSSRRDGVDLNGRVSQEVAERRRTSGMRQIDMWTALGMSKPAYRRLEQNQSQWTFVKLEAVAGVLGVRVSELVRAAEERPT